MDVASCIKQRSTDIFKALDDFKSHNRKIISIFFIRLSLRCVNIPRITNATIVHDLANVHDRTNVHNTTAHDNYITTIRRYAGARGCGSRRALSVSLAMREFGAAAARVPLLRGREGGESSAPESRCLMGVESGHPAAVRSGAVSMGTVRSGRAAL